MLLLDEPLSALDEFLRLQMRAELKFIQIDLGITFIHVTHTQPEALAIADMVVVMDTGRIEQAATGPEIYDEPRTTYVAEFMGGWNVVRRQGVRESRTIRLRRWLAPRAITSTCRATATRLVRRSTSASAATRCILAGGSIDLDRGNTLWAVRSTRSNTRATGSSSP